MGKRMLKIVTIEDKVDFPMTIIAHIHQPDEWPEEVRELLEEKM
jgi:hypothetical protein